MRSPSLATSWALPSDLLLGRVRKPLTVLGGRCVSAWLGLGTPGGRVLSVSVTLEESADPVIWRRLRVPADIRLDRFHQVLGAAMGWQDSHLHLFERAGDRYGYPDPDLDMQDEREKTLGDLLVDEGDRLEYEYDFGDSWRHDIVLDAIETGDLDDAYPRCTDGEGRCPPEDVGGTPGYERLRRVIADPDDAEHTEMLEWLGLEDAREFDAAAFELDRANAAMAGVLAAQIPSLGRRPRG
jgi:pRiA4b ORF-3-like protein